MVLLGRDEAKMGISRSTLAAILAGVLVTGVTTQAHAQAPILAAQADSRIQAEAEVFSRILASRPAFAETGERVGRIATVRVGPDGTGVGLPTRRQAYLPLQQDAG